MSYVLYLVYKTLVPPQGHYGRFSLRYLIFLLLLNKNTDLCKKKCLRWPGVEPGSTAWKAAMLTVIPPSHFLIPRYKWLLLIFSYQNVIIQCLQDHILREKIFRKLFLPDGELNPGLPRDRRGYSPLYYRGLVKLRNIKY